MYRFFSFALIFLLLASLFSCSSSKPKPEDEIHKLINSTEKLIEEHQGRKVKQIIADNYSDEQNRNKKDLEQILTYYLLRHQKIHILKRITELAFTDPDTCTATVYAAMAGTGGEIKEMLSSLQTDVYKFTFSLTRIDKKWLLRSAHWERASKEDIAEIWASLSK